MNAKRVRFFKDSRRSFIYLPHQTTFLPWHHHPEYELSLINKGKGIRMVGDRHFRFKENDLVLIGANTPHESRFDKEYCRSADRSQGEVIMVQFVYEFLGESFFQVPENNSLQSFITESSKGYVFFGQTKKKIISMLHRMEHLSDVDQIYSILDIFRIFSTTKEFKTINTSSYHTPFLINDTGPMQRALQYILKNFRNPICLKDLLEITDMSHTSFYAKFKKTYQKSFKDYLLNIRVGYACKLLTEGSKSISEIAYESGFENISNFNRLFKKIKGDTPSGFQEQSRKSGSAQNASKITA